MASQVTEPARAPARPAWSKIRRRGCRLHLSSSPSSASAYLGEIRYEQGDLGAASEVLEAGFSLREESGVADIALGVYPALTRLHEARGDRDGALALLYEGARHASAQRLERLAAAVLHEEVRLQLAAGNLELAARRLGPEPESAPSGRRQAWEVRRVARARLLIAQGRPGPARQLLAPLLEAAVADGPALHTLLRRLPTTGSAYVARVLAAIAPARSSTEAAGGKSPLIEPLNVREQQILRLVEEGMVNKDISTNLGIGLDTVKWHLKNAYKKLGVATRTGAIHAARAAGVLGAKTPAPRLKAPARR